MIIRSVCACVRLCNLLQETSAAEYRRLFMFIDIFRK